MPMEGLTSIRKHRSVGVGEMKGGGEEGRRETPYSSKNRSKPSETALLRQYRWQAHQSKGTSRCSILCDSDGVHTAHSLPPVLCDSDDVHTPFLLPCVTVMISTQHTLLPSCKIIHKELNCREGKLL